MGREVRQAIGGTVGGSALRDHPRLLRWPLLQEGARLFGVAEGTVRSRIRSRAWVSLRVDLCERLGGARMTRASPSAPGRGAKGSSGNVARLRSSLVSQPPSTSTAFRTAILEAQPGRAHQRQAAPPRTTITTSNRRPEGFSTRLTNSVPARNPTLRQGVSQCRRSTRRRSPSTRSHGARRHLPRRAPVRAEMSRRPRSPCLVAFLDDQVGSGGRW